MTDRPSGRQAIRPAEGPVCQPVGRPTGHPIGLDFLNIHKFKILRLLNYIARRLKYLRNKFKTFAEEPGALRSSLRNPWLRAIFSPQKEPSSRSSLRFSFRPQGIKFLPRSLRRGAPLPPRVSSAGGALSSFEVSFRRPKIRNFASSDSSRGLLRWEASLPPSVFSSGRHLSLLRFSRGGGMSTSQDFL